jgi:hypothetical protein
VSLEVSPVPAGEDRPPNRAKSVEWTPKADGVRAVLPTLPAAGATLPVACAASSHRGYAKRSLSSIVT